MEPTCQCWIFLEDSLQLPTGSPLSSHCCRNHFGNRVLPKILFVIEGSFTCVQVHRGLEPVLVHPSESPAQVEEGAGRVGVVGVGGWEGLTIHNIPIPGQWAIRGNVDLTFFLPHHIRLSL